MSQDILPTERELVARFLERDGGWTTDFVANIRSGRYDRDDRVQVAATARAEALEEAAKIAEAELKLGHEGYDLTGFAGENTRCRTIASAIRALVSDDGGKHG